MKFFHINYLALSVVVVLADQISKWWIYTRMIALTEVSFFDWLVQDAARLPFKTIEVFSFFNIVMVWNFGVSFGFMNTPSDWGPIILKSVTLLAVGAFVIWILRTRSHTQAAGLAMIVGGAMGNFVDRWRYGAVMDFLDFHVVGWHWPAFNVADSCICIGVALLLFHAMFLDQSASGNSKV
jgi:signal peptidase II